MVPIRSEVKHQEYEIYSSRRKSAVKEDYIKECFFKKRTANLRVAHERGRVS